MSDLRLPSWICAVPLCRVTHTVEEALGALYQCHASQLVLTTHQDHAFALLSLKDLLWGLASRVLRLEQDLATVPLHQPLCLLLLTEQSPQKAWWTVWQRLGNADWQASALDYGFINLKGDFLGVLDYSQFLNRLVEYCPGNPLQSFQPIEVNEQDLKQQDLKKQDHPVGVWVGTEFGGVNYPLQNQLAQVFLNYSSALIQDNQRLCLENQYKVILLDRLGHDLKTPLTSIVGLASLLKETSGGLPPKNSPLDSAQVEAIVQHAKRQGYYGEIIYQNSRYLMDLVNRLLELARLENQQKVLSPQYMRLQPLLNCCWSQAQGAADLRTPPHPSGPPLQSPCPELDPNLQIWGDQEACEMLLTLVLTHSLEQQTTSPQTTSPHLLLTAVPWGQPLPAWIILQIQVMGGGDEEEDSGGAFSSMPMPPHLAGPNAMEPLNLWIARRFAQWQGGDLNVFGSTLALLLPQTSRPLEIADTADPSFLLIGLSHPEDWLALDPLTPLVAQLKTAGIYTLFATDPEELVGKWERFQPAILLLDCSWTAAWESLALHCALRTGDIGTAPPLQQRKILGIALESAPIAVSAGDGLAQACFRLPQESQRLWANLSAKADMRGGQVPVESSVPSVSSVFSTLAQYSSIPISSTDALLWLGQSGPENRFTSLFPGCQILEAEDVEQAELLVQIWAIQAIVMGGMPLEEREAMVRSIRQSEVLAPLQLISLDDLQIPLSISLLS